MALPKNPKAWKKLQGYFGEMYLGMPVLDIEIFILIGTNDYSPSTLIAAFVFWSMLTSLGLLIW